MSGLPILPGANLFYNNNCRCLNIKHPWQFYALNAYCLADGALGGGVEPVAGEAQVMEIDT